MRATIFFALTLIACGAKPASTASSPDLLAGDVSAHERDSARVLFVDHWPRWEYRFLKNALIRDGQIKAHILLTSAEPSFVQDHSPGLDAIKEFPATLKQLLEYDVLILGDVPLEKIGGDPAAKMIDAFVHQEGRGLILLSGTECDPQNYAGTPLENLLPVLPLAPPHATPSDFERPYRLTHEGTVSEILRMTPDMIENTRLWNSVDEGGRPNLPRVRYFVPTKLRESATALVNLVDPSNDTELPLFITMKCGRGRVFFSATDETYRWRWLRGDAPYFFPFWKRAIFWAAGP